MDKVILLLRLARLGAMEHFITITTKQLGIELGVSQQSASIYLKDLGSKGLIERTQRRSGSSIRITSEGVDMLVALHSELDSLLDTKREIEVVGKITQGLGEGAYYLSQKGYIEQLKKIFSIDPFPGTLNITLSKQDAPFLDLLKRGPGIMIEGFRSGERTFGSCLCYTCTVEGVQGIIMVPNRTLHVDTVEVVSEVRLRDILALNDGDEVRMKVTYPDGKGPGPSC